MKQTDEMTQYLTFTIDGENFAFEINQVREVLDYTKITRIPSMPDFMRGVMNLRGSVVPVMDMKQKFGQGKTGQEDNTCIIIVETNVSGESIVIGALADSVEEVISLNEEQIEPPPDFGLRLSSRFIKGMGQIEEQFIIIIDVDHFVSALSV